MLIDGFIAYLSPAGAPPGATGAQVLRVARGLHYTPVPGGVPFAVRSPHAERGSLSRTAHFVRTFPGSVRSTLSDETASLAPDPRAWQEWAQRRLPFHNLIHRSPESFEIRGDLLGGLKTYQAWVGDGLVVASSIRALLCAFPELLQPADPVALAEMLVGGSPGWDRTLHARIKVSVAGQQVTWSPESGPRLRSVPRLKAPGVTVDPDPARLMDRIHADLTRSFLNGIADPSHVVLPLTGGFDSRLLACVAKDADVEVEAVTLGKPRHMEVRAAAGVARTLGLRHRVVDAPNVLEHRIPAWLEATEGQVSAGTSFFAGLCGLGFPTGTTVQSGYPGDLLHGGLLHWIGDRPMKTLSDVAEVVIGHSWTGARPDFPQQLGLGCTREDVRDGVLSGLQEAPDVHQSLALYYLEQPRGFASQLGYLGTEYHVGMPFYDARLMETWLGVPRRMVTGKAFVRELLRDRWPAVQAIPHSDERATGIPATWEAWRYRAHWTLQYVGHGLQKRLLPPSRRIANPTDIWHYWQGASSAERDRQIAFIREHGPVVGAVLGWELPLDGDKPLWEEVGASPQRVARSLRGTYLITEYCIWIRRAIRDTVPAQADSDNQGDAS